METQKGPSLSCKRPARIKLSAKTETAILNVVEVCERVQWKSFSSGATKTLQPYRVPNAIFMERPPITRHQRLVVTAVCGSVIYLAPFSLLEICAFKCTRGWQNGQAGGLLCEL